MLASVLSHSPRDPVSGIPMESLRSNLQQAYKNNFSSSIRSIPNSVTDSKRAAALAAIKLAEATHDLPVIWHDAMTKTVVRVRYRKSFRRLTGRDICGYDVIAYRDLEPMWTIVSGVLGNQFDKSDLMLDDSNAMAALWDTLDAMSESSMMLTDKTPQSRPTSQQISDEIQAHKQKKKPEPSNQASSTQRHDLSMAQWLTFRHAVQTVASAFGTTATADREAWEKTFDDIVTEPVNGSTVIATLEKNDDEPILAQSKHMRKLVGVEDEQHDAQSDVWVTCGKEFKKLYNMRQLQQSLPPSMMSKIESHASDLAMKLQRGDMDMSEVNMASIGESILGGCTETDIDSLSNNIGTLLPTLNKLATSVKDDSRSADLIPESMQNILSQAQNLSQVQSASAT